MTEETNKISLLNKRPDDLTDAENLKMNLIVTAVGAALMVDIPLGIAGVAGAFQKLAEKRAIKKAQPSEDPT